MSALEQALRKRGFRSAHPLPPQTPDPYTKKLRNGNGKVSATATATETLTDNLWNKSTRIVDMAELFSDISGKKSALHFTGFTSAQFALSMVEGMQKVRFIRGQAPV
ncbi:MAG: hypothetical protein IPJ82_09935 [Lewinellaceae bacterium]|nr:hypothetical protein [Lewinellaceae bacterium]